MNKPTPDSDPDSRDQIDGMLRDSQHGDGISRLIERLGGALPTIDLQPSPAGDDGTPVDTPPHAAGSTRLRRGNIHILGEIARGGMGVVLRGHEFDLRRDVAIKVLQQRHAKHPDVLARFVEEAQIGGQLQHPGIVPVYEIGVLADQRPYFTMKLVKGQTLAERFAQRADTAAATRQLLDIFQAVCLTMAYAHSRRVIHRDLKPENVMVGAFGEVQVVDWGLAKVIRRRDAAGPAPAPPPGGRQVSIVETLRGEPGSAGASLVGSVLGTPAYMPPEQARGFVDELDERSDVFSLGAILCELLTGSPPYGHDFRTAIAKAANGDLAAAMQRLDQCGADAPLVALCKQCLSPAPAARPADAGVLAQALRDHLASVEQRALDARLEAVAATTRAEAARRTRNLTVALALTGVLAVAIGGGGYLWMRLEREQRLQVGIERTNAALAEANLLRGQQRWPEAAAAARRAADLVPEEASPTFASGVRRELAELEARAQAERAAAELAADNARLLQSLRAIAEPDGGRYAPTDWARVDRQFAAAFAAHGLAVDSADAAAIAPLSARGIDVLLAQSLVEWAAVRRAKADTEGADRLLRVAMALDPDPDRVALRNAVLARNPDAVVALAKAPSALGQAAATLVELVRALRAVGRSSEAIDVQLAACLRHPDDALLAMEVASALRAAGRAHEAARLLQGALALRPDSLVVRRSLACVLEVDLREYALAEQFVRESLRQNPEDAYLHLRLGQCLLAKERVDPNGIPISRQPETPGKAEALAAIETAIRLTPHADYLQVLGNTLLGLGRFAEAAASARRGLALAAEKPSDPLTHAMLFRNLAIALDRSGDRAAATQAMQSALAMQPDDTILVCGYAILQSHTDRPAAMAALREHTQRHPEAALAHSTLADLLTADGAKDAALAAAQRAVACAPEDPLYRVRLVLTARQLQAADVALAACEQALREHPGCWELWDLQSILLRAAGRAKELRERLEAGARRDPTNPVVTAELGRMLRESGDHAGAAAMIRRAIQQGLDTPGVYDNLAQAVLAAEGPAAAQRVIDEAIPRWPDLAALYWRRGSLRLEQKQLDPALADAEQAVRLAPGRAFGHELLASVQLARGEPRAAAQAARAAVRPTAGEPAELEPPSTPDFAFVLGTELLHALPAEAAELLRIATERQPKVAEAWCNLGHALAGAGRFADALVAMQKGHDLGKKVAGWEYPSDQWVAQMQFFDAAEGRWQQALAAGSQPDEPEEQLGMLKWALARGEAATVLRLGDRLLADGGPAAADETGIRSDCSKAAMLVAGTTADADARAALQRRARKDLGLHLATMRRIVASDAEARQPVALGLQMILTDDTFAPVRGDAALELLAPDEAAAWRQLWAELAQTLASLRTK